MTNFNDDPGIPSNQNRPRDGRWSSAMWIVVAAVIVVLLFVIGRIGFGTSDMVEQRASAPETQTTSGIAPTAPATPAPADGASKVAPPAPESPAKP